MKTIYDERFFIVENNVAIKVKAKTYKKDKRLFIHRGKSGYQLSDKETGLKVVIGKTLKAIDEKYHEKINLYNKIVKGRFYSQFKSEYRDILTYGKILIE